MQKKHEKPILNRLKRIEGQVRGITKMVEEDKYCVDIITQSSAVRSALSSVEDILLENHLSEHVIHQMRGKEANKATAEMVAIFKKAKNK